jgi:uncharacterized integral membrane protein (TIGR00698 family)
LVPGVAAAVALTLVALVATSVLSGRGLPGISPVFLAIAAGLVVGRVVPSGLATRLAPGLQLVSKRLLRVAIVLLGLRFSLGYALEVGGQALGTIIAVVVTGLVVARLVGRWLRIDTTLALLIGVGTAICGNSAIAATAPIVKAREDEVSFASVVITGFGVVAMLTLPAFGRLLGLEPADFGVLAGAGVHDAAQAIAAGFLYGPEAGGVATIVKLARTAFLIPLVIALGIAYRGRSSTSLRGRVASAVPLFAVGFLVAAVVRTAGDRVLGADTVWWVTSIDLGDTIAGWSLVTAMAAMGLQARFSGLRRAGPAAVLAGLVTAVACGAVALASVLLAS